MRAGQIICTVFLVATGNLAPVAALGATDQGAPPSDVVHVLVTADGVFHYTYRDRKIDDAEFRRLILDKHGPPADVTMDKPAKGTFAYKIMEYAKRNGGVAHVGFEGVAKNSTTGTAAQTHATPPHRAGTPP